MRNDDQQPNNLDQERLLRAQGRLNHATVAKRLSRLIKLMGWDQDTHQFLHAAKFEALFNLAPSDYLELVAFAIGAEAQVSRVAEDHLSAEGLAMLVLTTDGALRRWQQNPRQDADEMAALIQELAANMLAARAHATGKPFMIDEHVREQFTLSQAKAYIEQHRAEYDALPGQWYLDLYSDEFGYVDTLGDGE